MGYSAGAVLACVKKLGVRLDIGVTKNELLFPVLVWIKILSLPNVCGFCLGLQWHNALLSPRAL